MTKIAAACGVSAMTVSRALRANGRISESTRRKVLDAAKRLGYLRAPRMGRPTKYDEHEDRSRVDVIVSLVENSVPAFHSFLVTAIEQRLSERGCDCVIRTCDDDYEKFLRLGQALRTPQAAGTMLIGEFPPDQLRCLIEGRPGSLLLDNPGNPSLPAPFESFGFDNAEAAGLAVRHLLTLGRQRILLVAGTPDHFFTGEIETGYLAALRAARQPIDPTLIVHADFNPDRATEVVNEVLDRGITFDAVFTNDEMASGVYLALKQRGLRIPDDVAVCGCDGLPLGKHLYPRLTSIMLDFEDLADRAVRHLFERDLASTGSCRVKILPRLIVRESTGVTDEHDFSPNDTALGTFGIADGKAIPKSSVNSV